MNARTAFHPARDKPRRLTSAYKRQLRQAAEVAIERLIAFLDDIDGDPDLEPYLSQTSGPGNQEREWLFPAQENDTSDDEPWLSAPEPTVSFVAYPWFDGQIVRREFDPLDQSRWGSNTIDAEEECDDEGDDSDREPDLFADSGECGDMPFVMDQSDLVKWAYGPRP